MHAGLVPPRRTFPALARRAALVILAAGIAAAPAAAQGAPPSELASYRLTMPNVEKVVAASRNLKALENDPEIKRWAAAQKAEEERREAQASENAPENPDATYKRAIAAFQGQPKIRRAIESTGLTVDGYFKTTLALGFAMMAHAMEKQSGAQQKAGTDVAGQNLQFVRQNETRLNAVMEEMKKYEMKSNGEQSTDEQEERDPR